MRYLFTLVMTFTCFASAAMAALIPPLVRPQVEGTQLSITFTGTVKSIEPLGRRQRTVIPVDFDSRFAVVIRIASVTPTGTPIKSYSRETFAIHSPARLFRLRNAQVIGKKFRFKLNWERLDDKSDFSQLRADPLANDQATLKSHALMAPPQASNMIATIYDDGKSCPNNCDAHVVFNAKHNGTRNAFAPSSSRSTPTKCLMGQLCRICFSEAESSCMLATYRGGGPAIGRFDFTPAFYEENCPKPNLPTAFDRQCKSAQPAIATLKKKINCVAEPEHEKCKALMTVVIKRKADDDVLYEECKSLGEEAFNRKFRTEPTKQRSNDCAYENQKTGGPNSKGERWRRLLDGACRAGTYAGKDGLDCCSTSLYAAATLGKECRSFFVPR